MFTPSKFKQEDSDVLLQLMRDKPFATLIGTGANGIEAMHLPFVVDERAEQITLRGHIAKMNTIWQQLAEGSNVLAVFSGPNCYISPNHYPTKAKHGKAVPTWNYVVVHARGSIKFIHDKTWLAQQIDDLSAIHEASSATPWQVSDAPANYIEKMLPAIVGVEIRVNALQGQWKLSQNQPEKNKQGVIDGLNAQQDTAALEIAALVEAFR